MRKQELVQLHVLGVLVRDRLEHRYDLPPEPFGPYEEYGVEPTAIYRTKDAHREALLRLVDGLATAADRRPPEADGTREPSRPRESGEASGTPPQG